MSHALYPGLNNNPRGDRPTTADSYKTWYGNNRKSYESTSAYSDGRSVHSHAPEAPGEDLGDLINRSRRVLSVLSVDEEARRPTQRSAEHQSTEWDHASSDHAESSSSVMKGKHEGETPAVTHEECEQGQEAYPEPIAGSHQAGAVATTRTSTSAPSLCRTTTGTISSPSSNSTIAPLAGHDDSPISPTDTIVSKARLSASGSESRPESSLHGGHARKTGSLSHLTEAEPYTLTVHPPSVSDLASERGGISIGTPALDDMAAGPGFSIAWGEQEQKKRPESVQVIPTDSSDSDSFREGPKEKAEMETEKEGLKEEADEEDPTATHLSGVSLISITIALSAAVFLVAMDVNVIATAIPRITGEFRSLDDVGWYGSAFLMATCATQIPYGRIYSIFSAKWVFTSAILVFMLGSLIAGISPSSPVLIFGRAVQGFGTSGILSGGLIIMSQVVPLRIRPILTGVIGAMEGVAMISAPIIGGVLTDHLHWRWCFYINLPIGGFVLLVVLFCMRTTRPPKKPTRRLSEDGVASLSRTQALLRTLHELDIVGAVTLLPPIVCMLLALHFAGE